jgi:hypothetical protein
MIRPWGETRQREAGVRARRQRGDWPVARRVIRAGMHKRDDNCYLKASEGPVVSREFTMQEALEALPEMSTMLAQAREAAVRAGGLENEMQELSQRIFLSGGLHVDVPAAARRRAERDKAMGKAREAIETIESGGVQVAENEEGGLEFPFALEGRTVLLCWTVGDEGISQWREESDETGVRRAIDGRFWGNERERPN